jgi:WD40 repeat protein
MYRELAPSAGISTRMAVSRLVQIIPRPNAPVRTFEDHEGSIQAVVASSMSTQRYMVTGSADNIVGLWNLNDGIVLKKMEERRDWVRAVAVSPEG